MFFSTLCLQVLNRYFCTVLALFFFSAKKPKSANSELFCRKCKQKIKLSLFTEQTFVLQKSVFSELFCTFSTLCLFSANFEKLDF